MERCTIIIGNGLGMALDSQYFLLESGLKTVWSNTESFSKEQKDLIISAIPELSSEKYPGSEEQLDRLQVALVAVDSLKSFESENVKWLSEESRELPQAFRKFLHEVGRYFYHSEKQLPHEFVLWLVEFIKDTKSHVATLNYDNLLYEEFKKHQLCDGYNGSLIDGFWSSGFDNNHLDRHSPEKFGWYLHLHGSFLYVGDKKLMRDEKQESLPTEKSHIVLTHVKHKPMIIGSSNILSAYWKRFGTALNETEKIILFGYSGCDTHLNETLCLRCKGKPIHIIEWQGGDAKNNRKIYWEKRLKECEIKLRRMPNILNFKDWKKL